MGFSAVLALVFGSQIGSGIFVLPAALAPFGMFGVFGWAIAGLGAVLLAFVFAELCSKLPQTGGPHAYVRQVFGQKAGFFVGWTYWLVSWVSTSVVFIAAISSLSPFIGKNASPYEYLFWEIILLSVITAVNCKSVEFAGKVESIFAILKLIPFVIVPLVLFTRFDLANISMSPQYADVSFFKLAVIVATTSFWGFIGVECATAPAGAVRNPSKTIPRAIILGTLGVAAVYVVSSLSVMGAIPSAALAVSKAPYVDAINLTLGENISKLVSLVTFIIMAGTSNAWTLTAAQASLGLAQNGMLPAFLAKKNKNAAPYVGVIASGVGILPILILSTSPSLSEQISGIIDFSVGVFLIVYATCCLAFIKISFDSRKILKVILGIIAFLFCLIIIINSSVESTIVSLLFIASGILVMPFAKFSKEKKA
jgi:APA family basic amino acid/polyamine antiporter